MPEKLFPKAKGKSITKSLESIFSKERISRAHNAVKERYAARLLAYQKKLLEANNESPPPPNDIVSAPHRIRDINTFINIIGSDENAEVSEEKPPESNKLKKLSKQLTPFGETDTLDHIIAGLIQSAYAGGYLENGKLILDSAKKRFGAPVELTAFGPKARDKKATALLNSMESDVAVRQFSNAAAIQAATAQVVGLKHKILRKCEYTEFERERHRILAEHLDSEAKKFDAAKEAATKRLETKKRKVLESFGDNLHNDIASVRTGSVHKKRTPRKFGARFAA